MTVDISRLDVPLPVVEAEAERLWAERDRRIAKALFAARMERLAGLLAHPEAALVPNPAGPCERAEWRHWFHDADPDSTIPAFRVDLTKHTQEAAS